eukprot:14211366-Alexandrium_andersonii.AAC.1
MCIRDSSWLAAPPNCRPQLACCRLRSDLRPRRSAVRIHWPVARHHWSSRRHPGRCPCPQSVRPAKPY